MIKNGCQKFLSNQSENFSVSESSEFSDVQLNLTSNEEYFSFRGMVVSWTHTHIHTLVFKAKVDANNSMLCTLFQRLQTREEIGPQVQCYLLKSCFMSKTCGTYVSVTPQWAPLQLHWLCLWLMVDSLFIKSQTDICDPFHCCIWSAKILHFNFLPSH